MEIKEDILGASNGDADIRFINLKTSVQDPGNEIEEIISSKQPFVVRWGTLFFFVLLLFVAMIAWMIRYPDIVMAGGILSSINAPKEVIARADGKLVKLFVAESRQVKTGNILGYIESTANHEEILQLNEQLDKASGYIRNDQTDKLAIVSHHSFDSLGELQGSFQVYMQSLREFSEYLSSGFYLKKKKMLNEDIGYLNQLHATLLYQKTILSQDLLLADSTFKANETLKDQNVISSFDYRIEKSKLLAKEMTLPQVTSSIISNENQQHEKQKEIAELENRIQQQKGIFIQALNTFKSQVEDWKKKYLLIAPVDGKVSFATFLQENQQLKSGQLICFVNPGNTGYYIEARIPQYNFGKIKDGQPVLLKFAAYPYQEFGAVRGMITAINTIPTDSGYLAKIELPEGLVTNYKKNVRYRTGLSVQAEIITENKRLLQRLFENIIKKTNR